MRKMKTNLSSTVLIRHLFTAGRGLLWVLLTAALLAGCEQVRQVTYPPDFVYLDEKQVRGQMALMNLYMREIDEILVDNYTINSEQQAHIIRLLNQILASVDRLGAGNVQTSHLLIDEHIDDFRTDVQVALNDASADPPNYYALGLVYGSCTACHQYR
jgi:hypothetical protein